MRKKRPDKTGMDFVSRMAIGLLTRLDYPGIHACGRCGISGEVVELHVTFVVGGRGVSVLCLECMLELTPDDRLPYYMAVYNRWLLLGCGTYYTTDELRAAVLNEVIND